MRNSNKGACICCKKFFQLYISRDHRICNGCLGIYWIYAYKMGPYVKIGYTEDLKLRLNSIKSSTPYLVSIIYSRVIVGKKITMFVEREVHVSLGREKFHMKGEWYLFNNKIINLLENKIIELFTEHNLNFDYIEKQVFKPNLKTLSDYGD